MLVIYVIRRKTYSLHYHVCLSQKNSKMQNCVQHSVAISKFHVVHVLYKELS